MENQVIKYRREDKYIFNIKDYNLIKSSIIRMGFKKAHSSNVINNIYYDFNQKCFDENIEGETNRTKYRLRWYDNKKDYKLEIKKKNGKAGFKKRIDINSLNIKKQKNEIINLLPPNYKEVLVNKYFREYFIMNEIRITLDSGLKFKFPNDFYFKTYNKNIAEVKYSINSPYKEEIIKNLGLKLIKFSKFAEGIDFLKNYKSYI